MARLFVAVAFIAVASAAVAAPVPKPPPPLNPKTPATFTLGLAKLNGQNIELTTTDEQYETEVVKDAKDGKPVETPALRLKQVSITWKMPLAGVKGVIGDKRP